jgi:hypothetical protein
MGSLNCQKCFNNEYKVSDELITGNNPLKTKKVVLALDSFSQKYTCDNYYQNNIIHSDRMNSIKERNKRFSCNRGKRGKKNEEEENINNLEYNTMEVVYNDNFSNSYDENEEEENSELDSEDNYNIRLKNAEELFGCDEQASSINESINDNKNINNCDNFKINDKIKKDIIVNGNDNLNDLINEKFREKEEKIFESNKNDKEIKGNKEQSFSNYNIIIGNSCLHYNYQYNLYNNDIELLNGGNINKKMNREYLKKININDNNKYKSSTFSNFEKKDLDNNENSQFEDTIKSEDIRRNKNESNEIQIEEGKSVISYEVETLDDNMNKNNSKETVEEENINIKDQMNLLNYNETKKDKQIFIKEIEKKLRDDIYTIKDLHNQYIITDAFCDYKPDI